MFSFWNSEIQTGPHEREGWSQEVRDMFRPTQQLL